MELKASSGAGALEASQELRHWKNREELDTGTGSIARSWPLEALYGTGGVSRQQGRAVPVARGREINIGKPVRRQRRVRAERDQHRGNNLGSYVGQHSKKYMKYT